MQINLPPPQRSAASTPLLNGEISTVYPDAIELGSNRSTFRGVSIIGIIIELLLVALGAWATFSSKSTEDLYFYGGLTLATLIPLFIGIRLENFTYYDQPTLFNRKTKKVHFFRVKKLWYKPFSHWPASITSYDWTCVRARVLTAAGGSVNVPALNTYLWLDILEKPDSSKVIDSYSVGTGQTASVSDRRAAWEHIRRYMQGSGVALDPEFHLLSEDMSNPGRAFLSSFTPENDDAATTAHVMLFPVFLPMAVGAALISITGFKPEWPTEILEAAGGAPLTLEEIRAQAEHELRNLKEELVEPEHKKWA